jgi:hypothetical protein
MNTYCFTKKRNTNNNEKLKHLKHLKEIAYAKDWLNVFNTNGIKPTVPSERGWHKGLLLKEVNDPLEEMAHYNIDHIINNSMAKLCRSIVRSREKIMKLGDNKGVKVGTIEEIRARSCEEARRFLNNNFRSFCYWSSKVYTFGEQKEKLRENDIEVALNWVKTVNNKGLAMIRGTKGVLFVTKAEKLTKENIPKIKDYEMPDCTIFKVITNKISRGGNVWPESGFLLIDNYEETDFAQNTICQRHGEDLKVHAFKANLKDAAKLLNRRVKGYILNQF